ncbi:MAG TPA: IS66 family transposase [Dongiaceae bacterium]|jgi:transposase|nr:IS66 family transposase [Dongiaceae bacterium]
MSFAPTALPNDVETLHRLIAAEREELAAARAGLLAKALEIETLKLQIARLRRQQYGRSSERMLREIEQFELRLEELEAEQAAGPAVAALPEEPETATLAKTVKSGRRPLPAHLPRHEIVHEPGCACPSCGGALRKVGEDVTEILDYIPARFRVIRHVRPAFSCRQCESMIQAPMPALPIERGRPGPGLLAHVLVAKYCDHLPLYRQSGIYAREGVELDRATLANWVGKAAWLLAPLVEAVAGHVMAAEKLHADDTPVPVLAPGTGKTKTGRLWVYLRDERPYGGPAPPAVVYRYSPDRRGEHPRAHLAKFRGFLQADGYAGFGPLYQSKGGQAAAMSEVACWAHVRRKIYDVHLATKAPIAAEALERIGRLFEVEREVNGLAPEARWQIRQARARPVIDEFAAFLDGSLPKLSGKGELAGAMRYARGRWEALTRYLDDGRLEISNNAAERAIRPLALGRKNYMFAGSDAGGERAAAIYTLVETAKLNDLDPEAYLRDVLGRIADHPINRIADLLPWNAAKDSAVSVAA